MGVGGGGDGGHRRWCSWWRELVEVGGGGDGGGFLHQHPIDQILVQILEKGFGSIS